MFKTHFLKERVFLLSLFSLLSFSVTAEKSMKAERAFQSFVSRVIGSSKAKKFAVELKENNQEGEDYFELKGNAKKVTITASNLSSATMGFNHYLKYYLKTSITGNGSRIRIPKKLPAIEGVLRKSTPLVIRNYLNYCTISYTMAFWDWKRWEKEIDWMALNGINQPLMITGTEKVWQNMLRRLKYQEKDIKSYIPSSAYTAWWLMGNLEGEGGPMSQEMIDYEYQLGKKIYKRMKTLGMEPILQGFVGLVPRSFSKYYKKAHVIPQGRWAGGYPRPSVLDPRDKHFAKVAGIWYEELHQLFAKPKYYGGDLFHEGGHSGGIDLKEAARAVYSQMTKQNKEAVWVMQAWGGNPKGAILQEMKKGEILVQCLDSNMATLPRPGYHGHDWTWNIINNFGGNDGLYGNLENLAKLPEAYVAKRPQNLVGLGNVSEGMLHNPVVYDLFADVAWEKEELDLKAWLQNYTQRRYGKKSKSADKAWAYLNRSIYKVPSNQQGATESVICARPNLYTQKASGWGSGRVYFDMPDLLKAANALLRDAKKMSKSQGYRYDCVDTVRQLMQAYARLLLKKTAKSYEAKDALAFEKNSAEFLELISDTDTLLATHKDFMFGTWQNDALKKGEKTNSKEIYEYSARMLVTTWVYRGTNLNDYSHRQWSGLMNDFYAMRWQHYFNQAKEALAQNKNAPHYSGLNKELAWIKEHKVYPTKATGHPVKVAKEMLKKYSPKMKKIFAESGVTSTLARLDWDLSRQKNFKQTLTFDVTKIISAKGKYKIKMDYQQGSSACKIYQMKIVKDGKTLAVDKHAGETGAKNSKNHYELKIKEISEIAGAVQLIIDVEATSALNSRGVLVISK